MSYFTGVFKISSNYASTERSKHDFKHQFFPLTPLGAYFVVNKNKISVDTSPIECSNGLQWQTNIENKVTKAIGAGIDYSPPKPFKCVTFSLVKDYSPVFNTGCASAYSPSPDISRRRAYDRAISYLAKGPDNDSFYLIGSQQTELSSAEKKVAAQCLYASTANWTDNGAYGPPLPPNLKNN